MWGRGRGEKRKEAKENYLQGEAVRLFRQSEQFVQALFTLLIKEVKVSPVEEKNELLSPVNLTNLRIHHFPSTVEVFSRC